MKNFGRGPKGLKYEITDENNPAYTDMKNAMGQLISGGELKGRELRKMLVEYKKNH